MGCGASSATALAALPPLPVRPGHAAMPAKHAPVRRDYALGRVIGEGGFARVLLAKKKQGDSAENVEVAVKEIRFGATPHAYMELKILHFLGEHAHVVQVLDYYVASSCAWLVMPFYVHGDAQQYFSEREDDPTILPDIAAVMRGLFAALEHCHAMGIAHMDVKPENLLLRTRNAPVHVVLTDFGSAVHVSSRRQMHRIMVGTASYVAPEVVRKKYLPCYADMWSAGMALYTIFASEPAYDGPYTNLTLQRILTTKIVLPLSITKRAPPSCRNLIMQLLRRHPPHRPTAAQALRHPWIASGGTCADDVDVPAADDPANDLDDPTVGLDDVDVTGSPRDLTRPPSTTTAEAPPTDPLACTQAASQDTQVASQDTHVVSQDTQAVSQQEPATCAQPTTEAAPVRESAPALEAETAPIQQPTAPLEIASNPEPTTTLETATSSRMVEADAQAVDASCSTAPIGPAGSIQNSLGPATTAAVLGITGGSSHA
eukprot:m.65822 g.65822  ORF g.65822 m.65822 type:complete len:487 (+) comp7355_c0_seq4:37-1497(+)